MFRELFYMAFDSSKGIAFFKAVSDHCSFGLTQITFSEEQMLVQVGKVNSGPIHQAYDANARGQEIKGSCRSQPTGPGNKYFGRFQAFLSLPSPPIQGYLVGVARHLGRT
jgi:hypothetical protein